MTNFIRNPINQKMVERNRASKMPTRADLEQAMSELPDANSFEVSQRAFEIVRERNYSRGRRIANSISLCQPTATRCA